MKKDLLNLKKSLYKLVLANIVIGTISVNVTGCESKKENVEVTKEETSFDNTLASYNEVTTPYGYFLYPGSVAVKNDSNSIVKMSTLNIKNNEYSFIGANHGSLNINGSIKDIMVHVNDDGSITYTAPDGYLIYEPYYVEMTGDRITAIADIKKLNPITYSKKELKR